MPNSWPVTFTGIFREHGFMPPTKPVFCGFWLQEGLQAKGIDCMVVHAADVPTTDKERRQKRDKRDSRKIAYALRGKQLEPIHVPAKTCQQDRALMRSRHKTVGNQTRCRNRIKALLYYFGVEYPQEFANSQTHWSAKFMAWLNGVDLGEAGSMSLSVFIEECEFYRTQLRKLNHRIVALSGQERYARQAALLRSVPGVGLLTALILLTEIEDIHRFKKFDQLCHYVGLVPNVSASGEREHVGDITRRGNKHIKSQLIESAWVAVRKDPALMLKYNQLCAHMNGNRAIIRIARKLLSRIRYVLMNQQEYQLAVVG
jgi:transposase